MAATRISRPQTNFLGSSGAAMGCTWAALVALTAPQAAAAAAQALPPAGQAAPAPAQVQDQLQGPVQILTRTDSGAAVEGQDVIQSLPVPTGAGTTASLGLTPDQLPGWPIQVGGHPNSSPSRGAVLADLDADGLPEIIVSAVDGNVYAWDAQGNPAPGFPVSVIQIPQYAPAVEDLEGDGDYEIVQFTRGFTSGGRMYVFDHVGNVMPGFPKSFQNNNLAGSPTLFDLGACRE